MTSGLIATNAALERLRPEWDQLSRRSLFTTPFQSPAWLLSWWHMFGTDQPRVATLHAHGRLVGLLPMSILDEPPARKLLPIDAGITDCQDVIPGTPKSLRTPYPCCWTRCSPPPGPSELRSVH